MVGQTTGRNATVMLSGRDISPDHNTFTLTLSAEAPETTAFGDTYRSRVADGIKDWTVELSGFYNDNTGAAEQQLNALLGASSIVGLFPQGNTTACEIGYENEAIATEYSIEAPVDNVVTLSSTWTGSGAIHRGFILHAMSACSTAGSFAAASRDYSASTAGDVHAFIRCTTASGTSPTLDVLVQHSGDDSAWTTLITFAQITAGSVAEHGVATSASRYRRAMSTLTGTNEDFTYMVTCE